MSGTILNTDGSVTAVNISDKTLMGAGKYYAKNSAGASDFLEMDICDIKKTLKNDSVEYITCIYQSNAGLFDKKVNQHFPKDYTCYGDILVVKTIKSPSSYYCDDILIDMDIDMDELLDLLKACGERARNTRTVQKRLLGLIIDVKKEVFPHVMCNGSEIDLLTMETKNRSFIVRKYGQEFIAGTIDDRMYFEGKKEKEIKQKEKEMQKEKRKEKEMQDLINRREKNIKRKEESKKNISTENKYKESNLKVCVLPVHYQNSSDDSSGNETKPRKIKRRDMVAEPIEPVTKSKNSAKKDAKKALKASRKK